MSHSRWLPLAGVFAGILIHNVALSALEWLETSIRGGKVSEFGAANAIILATGGAAGLASYFVALQLRRALEESVRHSGGSAGHSFLGATLAAQTPGPMHRLLLVLYGLTAIAFLAALHAVAHVAWHGLAHGLHVPHFGIIVASAAIALILAATVRRLERPESKVTSGEPGPNDALILFLSPADEAAIADFERILGDSPMPWKKGAVRDSLGAHRWVMPARSISRIWENNQLRHIVVIGSDLTWASIPRFSEVVRKAMGRNAAEIHVWPSKGFVDFFDSDAVKAAVQSAYEFLEERQCTRIAIDVTSGTVICSAVGLMETLTAGRGAIYVTKSLDVRAYTFEHRDRGWTVLPEEGI